MPTYECFVREQHREYIHPPVAASSLPEAIQLFREQGIQVLRVIEREQPRLRGVREREVTLFFRNLAEALNSSLPLTEALQLVGHASKQPLIQTACRDLVRSVRNGSRLSEAASRHAYLFAETHLRLIEAGEQCGRLDEAIGELADYRDESAPTVAGIAAIACHRNRYPRSSRMEWNSTKQASRSSSCWSSREVGTPV